MKSKELLQRSDIDILLIYKYWYINDKKYGYNMYEYNM